MPETMATNEHEWQREYLGNWTAQTPATIGPSFLNPSTSLRDGTSDPTSPMWSSMLAGMAANMPPETQATSTRRAPTSPGTSPSSRRAEAHGSYQGLRRTIRPGRVRAASYPDGFERQDSYGDWTLVQQEVGESRLVYYDRMRTAQNRAERALTWETPVNYPVFIDESAQMPDSFMATIRSDVKFSQWTGMWADVGVAHEAKVFMKEVSLENGKLVVGGSIANRSPE